MKNDAVKAPNRSNLFNDCLTGVVCVVLLFILVYCAALAVKERTCTIRFTDPLTGIVETREPTHYRIAPFGFEYETDAGWVYTTAPYVLYEEGQQW